MTKITLEQFEKMMEFDVVKNHCCVEVEFYVDDSLEYNSCCLGKTIDRRTKEAVYWYGLVPDGSQAYDYDSLCDFVSAPIFNGKSIKEIWSLITIYSIDGCVPDDRLKVYWGLEKSSLLEPTS